VENASGAPKEKKVCSRKKSQTPAAKKNLKGVFHFEKSYPLWPGGKDLGGGKSPRMTITWAPSSSAHSKVAAILFHNKGTHRKGKK